MDALDLTNPQVKAALQYQDAHATENIKRIFVSRHPELCNVSEADDIQNENAINKVIVENKWQYTPESLEAAYAVTSQRGELVINDLAHPSPQLQDAYSQASTAQLKQFFENQQPPAHVNRASEFFFSAGGRAKDTILNRGQR